MNNIWIVLQQEPLETTYFEDLQHYIKDRYDDTDMYSPEKLHMTLFHFGFPTSMYKDIKKEVKHLSYKAFEVSLAELFNELHSVDSSEILLTSDGIAEHFGSTHEGKVVLRFENSKKLKDKRKPYLDMIYEWMSGLGIHDPVAFMEDTRNFKHNSERVFRPHVTLGYSPKGFEKIAFPKKKIRFSKAGLFNYEKLFS